MFHIDFLNDLIQSRIFKSQHTTDTQVKSKLRDLRRQLKASGKTMKYTFQLPILMFIYYPDTFINRIAGMYDNRDIKFQGPLNLFNKCIVLFLSKSLIPVKIQSCFPDGNKLSFFKLFPRNRKLFGKIFLDRTGMKTHHCHA